jgi:hypothetical protein
MQPKAAGAERGWQPLQRGQMRGSRAGRALGAAALGRRAAAAHACRQRTALAKAQRTAAAQRPLACSACTLAPELASGGRSRLGPAEAWRCGATGGVAADQAGRGAGLDGTTRQGVQAACRRRSQQGGAMSGVEPAGGSRPVGARQLQPSAVGKQGQGGRGTAWRTMPVELAVQHVAQLGAQPRHVEHGRAEPATAACEARRGTARQSAWRRGGEAA